MRGLGALRLANGAVVERGQRLRELPGKRLVSEGRLDGRAVVLKEYLDPRRAPVHQRRETEGLAALHAAGIAAPEVLYAGDDVDGHPVVVLAYVEDAQDLASAWRHASAAQRERLVIRMMVLLATHHAAGIRQTDLHLANFLLQGEAVYTLDGAAVTVQPGPLDDASAQRNLALYCSQLTPDWDRRCIELSTHYCRVRGIPHAPLAANLPSLIEQARMGRWREQSDKIYRECTAVVARRSAVAQSFARRVYGPALLALLDNIEGSRPTDPAALLKNGNTATVWRASIDRCGVVVKRYNIKNRRHALALALKESRASRSWRFAHMLRLFGIATPQPVALLFCGGSRVGRIGYFLAEDIGGTSLRECIAGLDAGDAQVGRLARQAAGLLAGLKRLRLSHGDLKATNFILSGDELFIIDLDSMCEHRGQRAFEAAWRRDIERFDANWKDLPRVQAIMREALRAAAAD